MNPLVSRSVVLTIALLGCAKPNAAGTSSGAGGGDPDGGGHQVDAPIEGPASCKASNVREVRYGGTLAKQTKVPANIAALRCVADLSQLDDDIACARAFNEANWRRAMAELGLSPLDAEAEQLWVDDAEYGMEFGTVVDHPDDPQTRLVFVGMDRFDCSGVNVHTPVGPSTRLAERQDGEVVLVAAKPEVESRRYPRCSCNSGCGAMREDTPLFVELPAHAKFGGIVEIEYPAIAIVSHDVESQTCCCAP